MTEYIGKCDKCKGTGVILVKREPMKPDEVKKAIIEHIKFLQHQMDELTSRVN